MLAIQKQIWYIYTYERIYMVEKRKRLVLDVTPDEHKDIKINAAKRHITIRQWVLRAIARLIVEEERCK